MKPRKPRVHARSWFTGKLEIDELHARRARLEISRGSRRQKFDADGEMVSDTEEPGAVCWVNRGDKVMIFGPKIDEIATAEIVTCYPSGSKYYIAFRVGEVSATTKDVKILKLSAALKKPGSAA